MSRFATIARHGDRLSVAFIVLLPIVANALMLFGLVASNPALLDGGFTSAMGWDPSRGLPMIDPNVGFISEAVGRFVGRALVHGSIQWWNPYEGIGVPVGESLSAAGMFPLSALLYLSNGVAIERCVLEILSGVATWLLLRELGASRVAAVVAAAVYGLNGTASWLGTPWADPAPFLPLLLLGIERVRRRAVGGWAIVAVSIGLSILAGFPEIAYLYGLLAVGWAIVRIAQSSHRVRFAAALVTSGIAGVLLAAPALVGFADYLSVGYSGNHLGGAFAAVGLSPSGIPQVFLPYVWGPIFANPGVGILWGNVGGYAGVGLCTLALVAVVGRNERALRLFLVAWTVITLFATFKTPLVQPFFVALPLVKYTAYFRYLPTSWEFALAVLAAFAIDDIRAYRTGRAAIRIGFAVGGCCATVAWSLNAGGVDFFGDARVAYRAWIFLSLEGAIVILMAIAFAATLQRRRLRTAILAATLIAEAAAYYMIPERSFARWGTLDLAPIAFLQRNLGLQRFYTLRPIAPNYGTYFGIASINHNDLPVPARWIDYIRKNLDASTDGIDFVGWLPLPGPGEPTRADVMRANVHGFERAGVRYVVSSANEDPFANAFAARSQATSPPAPLLLNGSQALRYRVAGLLAPDTISGIDIQGPVGGPSAGALPDARICDDTEICAPGDARMRSAAGEYSLHVELRHPLVVRPPGLTVILTNHAGNRPVQLWTYPLAAGAAEQLALGGKPLNGRTLHVHFVFVRQARSVYADRIVSIYELPHPRPYFEAAGCRLSPTDRTELTASCTNPSELHRLELFIPGWHATVNGAAAPIVPLEDTFEAIHVPAGDSKITFWFLPPFIEYGFAAFAAALAAVGFSLFFDGRRPSRAVAARRLDAPAARRSQA